ncbi:hypothetical protein SLEP1_g21577 [Rubroshorea leprosula]|uniref:Receptor-like serine/threonine-protein kinase n=1 Tax=Rubroshorea leprosula TaxID=152421 RepID=A0AAV5JFN9_9ROSI|nr:hypothetical protein SLEP1_g21577 [Rubroshorea leprosula]
MDGRGRSLVLLCLSCLLIPACSTTDTLEQGKPLRYGELLKSSNDLFRLGFFRFYKASDKSFLGIWYNDYSSNYEVDVVQEPVWIANRNNPIFNGSGILSVNHNGCLQILSGEKEIFALYSTGASIQVQARATLKDDGNFVLRQLNSDGSEAVLWKSFDYPTDTLLPGMKLGFNSKTGFNWTLTSMRSSYSPASGSFTLGVDPNGTKQLVIWRRDDVYWRSGPWQNGSSDFAYLTPRQESAYSFNFTQNENETYFTFSTTPALVFFPSMQLESRDSYAVLQIPTVGYRRDLVSCTYPYSSSITGEPNSAGCVKQKLPECRGTMLDHEYIYPDYGSMSSAGFRFSDTENLTLEDCKVKCLLNCSCFAYATTNVDGTGCEVWTSRAFFRETNSGRAIYILPSKGNKWWLWLTIVVGGMMILPTLFSVCYIIWKKCTSNGDENINQRTLIKELEGSDAPSISFGKPKGHKKDRNELHVFSFESIVSSTNYFSSANKLGEGGFGPVYKGILFDGREVAIKRLSRSSGQGVAEFKNEALLIAKLQHTNLVRLLGFCIQGEEKILIYEYMPNKSLDSFLFDHAKKKVLNWKIRLNIIEGIAQGLLYLHKYSRLRVIHRDLKASNILLDSEMNPKISDFGMARIFGLNESEVNTNRVVGTYGYMSPEYAFHGLVSIKTDVFSFGVLLLELVSGMKNTGRYHSEHPLNLLGYTWQLWNEDRAWEVMDPTLDGFCPRCQILRCIHIGLLCVQDQAIDRPTMSDVVSMLSNETMPLPQPKQPAFFITTLVQEQAGGPEIKSENCSINQVSISVMEAR